MYTFLNFWIVLGNVYLRACPSTRPTPTGLNYCLCKLLPSTWQWLYFKGISVLISVESVIGGASEGSPHYNLNHIVSIMGLFISTSWREPSQLLFVPLNCRFEDGLLNYTSDSNFLIGDAPTHPVLNFLQYAPYQPPVSWVLILVYTLRFARCLTAYTAICKKSLEYCV